MSLNLPASRDHLHKLTGFTGSSGFAIVTDGDQDGNLKSRFVTDSRYEIAVKSEIDSALFEVSTKAEPETSVLTSMAKMAVGPLKVGLDAHLFTKAQI